MKPNYRSFVVLTRESFGSDLAPKKIMQTAEVLGVANRFEYAIRFGALALLTGSVGSGKSTVLPRIANRPHPFEYQIILVTAAQGFILELYSQICVELAVATVSFSRAVLIKFIRKQVLEIAQDRKKQPVLITNEASILRLQVLAELRPITQFQIDFKPIRPSILAGRNNLADLLIYRTALPLASRVVAKSLLAGISLQDMQAYLLHHLKIAGVKRNLFSDSAVTAIQ
ncbi:AAA family ATPase [Desulfarculales bacterium]